MESERKYWIWSHPEQCWYRNLNEGITDNVREAGKYFLQDAIDMTYDPSRIQEKGVPGVSFVPVCNLNVNNGDDNNDE